MLSDSMKVLRNTHLHVMFVDTPLIFMKKKHYGLAYLDMIQIWLMTQIEENSRGFVFQQDVKEHLNEHFLQWWMGHTGFDDDALLRWSPSSPDMTHLCLAVTKRPDGAERRVSLTHLLLLQETY
ncbi:hypothetical protein PR048_020540 [Dryococelus australis]|uniref:Uncharacterized protein n=1 Tax=Dryococelus australis TaxID=614101 RepID=A0ABQ9H6J0_9NEOP|nr:hypothetical protein PR048_020540 [Dryococelus australis]